MKTNLFDLPNEIFILIFQYLKSTFLVQLFSDIQSIRVRTLIKSLLSHLDISQETDQWIQTYLPDLFNRQDIIALRLQDRHIAFVSSYLELTRIQSMHVISSDWNTDILKENLEHIRQYLQQLTITFTCPHGQGNIASYLFQSDSQLQYLNIIGRFQFFDNHEITTSCHRLTYLSIELEGMHRLFILMKHLPNLEHLKVSFFL